MVRVWLRGGYNVSFMCCIVGTLREATGLSWHNVLKAHWYSS
jgi:hypothetical protein